MTKPYPWYYAVNDRLVKIVELPSGEVDAFAFDSVTGSFRRESSYLSRVFEVGIGKDVDAFTEEQFESRVHHEWEQACYARRREQLHWQHTGNGEFPYQTEWKGRTFTIRVNDFPAEPLYTITADGEDLEDLDDWPGTWTKQEVPQALVDAALASKGRHRRR